MQIPFLYYMTDTFNIQLNPPAPYPWRLLTFSRWHQPPHAYSQDAEISSSTAHTYVLTSQRLKSKQTHTIGSKAQFTSIEQWSSTQQARFAR